MISMGLKAVAGELGLEPRMTVPKTVVLPLHHSPADRRIRRAVARRRRSDTPSCFGMQHPLSGLFSLVVKMGRNGRLRPIKPMAISRVLTSGRRRQASPHGRSVAQPGRALRSGRRGRRFESSHSDHLLLRKIDDATAGVRPLPEPRQSSFAALSIAWRATAFRCAPTDSMVLEPSAFRRAVRSGEPAS